MRRSLLSAVCSALLPLACSKFGDAEGEFDLLKADDDTIVEHTDDEACCESARMNMRMALFAKFMAQLPKREEQPKSTKPEPFDPDNKLNTSWFCDFSKINSFHYIYSGGYAQSEKNTQFHDEFGQFGGERADWTSAAFNAERDMLFAPMIPKNAHSTLCACVMPSHFEYFDRPGGLGEDLKKGKLDLDKVMKYSVVRNPLGRFFSSHSQMEAFLAGVGSHSLHCCPNSH